LLSKNIKIKVYRTVNLSVLYGCETWSLTLREEHRLRAFENRVLRRIFGPERDRVRREWRGLHNKERNDLYSSPNIKRLIKSRRMRWAGNGWRIRMVPSRCGTYISIGIGPTIHSRAGISN
jgi:hypothetical protein